MKKALSFATLCLALLPLLLARSAHGQILNPIAFDGLRQWSGSAPFVLGWGYGDVFSGNPVDQTIADFELSGFTPGTQISSATLTFFDQVQHGGNTPQPLDLYTFSGESAVQATDWNTGTYFNSYADPYGLENLDVTAAVQSAINAGDNYLDFRFATTDPDCVDIIAPPWRSPGLTLDIVEVVPEPNTGGILLCGLGIAIIFVHGCKQASSLFT